MFKRLFQFIVIIVIVALICPYSYAGRGFVNGDTGQLGNDELGWWIDSTGDILPDDDDSRDIGSASYQVQTVYTDALVLNGVSMNGTATRTVPLPILSFVSNAGSHASPSYAILSTSTVPGLETDNLIPSIVWADGETSDATVTFRVPQDYSSDMSFRLFCDESGTSTANEVDFSVYVNRDGSGWDSAATNQTPVAVVCTAGATPDMVTLSVATDFASLAAGDVVTLNIWRDDTATGTNDLEVHYVEALYTASVE